MLTVWAVFIAFTINYGVDTAANLKEYYHHGITYSLWVIVFTAGFSLLISRIVAYRPESPFLEYFSLIGRNVTLAYVVQWVIIGNTGTAVFRSLDLRDSYIGLIVVVFITTVAVLVREKGFRSIIWLCRTKNVV